MSVIGRVRHFVESGKYARRSDTITTTGALSLSRGLHSGKTIIVTTTGVTVTLPLATTQGEGEYYTVVCGVAAPATVIAVTSGDTVNGGTTGKGWIVATSTDAIGDSATLISNGTAWYTVGQTGTWKAEA